MNYGKPQGQLYELKVLQDHQHRCPSLASDEDIVRQQTEQEGDVGLEYDQEDFTNSNRLYTP